MFALIYWHQKFGSRPNRGGFRHVWHVRPNRGPTKRGPPQKHTKLFHAAIVVCIAARVLNKMSMMCVSGEGSRGRGIHILGASTFFLYRGPVRGKSGPEAKLVKLTQTFHPSTSPLTFTWGVRVQNLALVFDANLSDMICSCQKPKHVTWALMILCCLTRSFDCYITFMSHKVHPRQKCSVQNRKSKHKDKIKKKS